MAIKKKQSSTKREFTSPVYSLELKDKELVQLYLLFKVNPVMETGLIYRDIFKKICDLMGNWSS